MDGVLNTFAQALLAAFWSPLGIAAWALVLLAGLGVIFLRGAGENFRLFNVALFFFAVGSFVFVVLQNAQPASPAEDRPSAAQAVLEIKPHQQKAPKSQEPAEDLMTRSALSMNLTPEAGYIYVGRWQGKQWQQALFSEADRPLRVGDELQLNRARNMYACAPYRKEVYHLGFTFCREVVGQTEQSSWVRVARPPVSVGLGQVWVYVTKMETSSSIKSNS